MSAIHQYIVSQRARALTEGIKIVRNILKSNPFPNGFTTAQLFEVAIQQPPPPDFPVYRHTGAGPVVKPTRDRYRKLKAFVPWAPSHPEHPIRSIRFLKAEVLPILAESFEIKKVKQNRLTPNPEVVKGRDPTVEFVWKVVGPDEVRPPTRIKLKKAVGKETGVN